MAKTLATVRSEVLRRLGDSTNEIWANAEIDRYLNEGYERMARARLLWGQRYLEDQSYAGSYTNTWELDYMEPGMGWHNQFHYTADWEIDYAFGDKLHLGPANHTAKWEYDNDYHIKSHYLAVHQIPSDVLDIERVVWNKKRIEPVYSGQLEYSDSQYQTQQGEVIGYIRDKDGPRSFRKWRIPSDAADEYTVTGVGYYADYNHSWEPDNTTIDLHEQFAFNYWWEKEYATPSLQDIPASNHTASWEYANNFPWGTLRFAEDVSAEDVLGDFGIPRRIPGVEPLSVAEVWGTIRRIPRSAKNTKIEYIRKGETLVDDDDEFDLPDVYVKGVRFFALYRAMERDGNGQDLDFAKFWKARYEAVLLRARRRKDQVLKTRISVLGGGTRENTRPPLARLPWNYGKVVG